jgi:hypothetical protein
LTTHHLHTSFFTNYFFDQKQRDCRLHQLTFMVPNWR